MMERKPEYFYSQSAVIPYRINSAEIEIVLITSRSGKRWVIPKGIIEPDLSPEDSALQEAYEEAGVRGEITGGQIGSFQYEKWGGILNVLVFPMKVAEELKDWPESGYRKRRWMTLREARAEIGIDSIRPLFDKLADSIHL